MQVLAHTPHLRMTSCPASCAGTPDGAPPIRLAGKERTCRQLRHRSRLAPALKTRTASVAGTLQPPRWDLLQVACRQGSSHHPVRAQCFFAFCVCVGKKPTQLLCWTSSAQVDSLPDGIRVPGCAGPQARCHATVYSAPAPHAMKCHSRLNCTLVETCQPTMHCWEVTCHCPAQLPTSNPICRHALQLAQLARGQQCMIPISSMGFRDPSPETSAASKPQHQQGRQQPETVWSQGTLLRAGRVRQCLSRLDNTSVRPHGQVSAPGGVSQACSLDNIRMCLALEQGHAEEALVGLCLPNDPADPVGHHVDHLPACRAVRLASRSPASTAEAPGLPFDHALSLGDWHSS